MSLDDHSDNSWKFKTCYDHQALVQEHLSKKAYYIAEKDGFKKTPKEYWQEALKVK